MAQVDKMERPVHSLAVCTSLSLNDNNYTAVTYIERSKECRLSKSNNLLDCSMGTGDGTVTNISYYQVDCKLEGATLKVRIKNETCCSTKNISNGMLSESTFHF